MRVWQFVDQKNLVYCDKWEDAASSVKAFVFEKMLTLGRDTIKHYNSDLYHDAVWLEKNLDGELNFEWIARESGTHIGDAAESLKDYNLGSSAIRYKFNVYHDGHRWVLDTFIEAPKDECTSDDPTNHQGDTCPVHEDPGMVSPVDSVIDEIFGIGNFPTLKETTIRKVNVMDSILRDLRDKLDEAVNVRDELEALQSDLNDQIDKANENIDAIESAIDALDINLEDIEFEANVSFDGMF